MASVSTGANGMSAGRLAGARSRRMPGARALKAWRGDRARAESVPAYVVANDRTLAEIASVKPTTPQQLLGVSGIGPAKLERFGDEILAIVEAAG